MKVAIICPPEKHHFKPLKLLAQAFLKKGADIIMACGYHFRDEVEQAGITYYPLNCHNQHAPSGENGSGKRRHGLNGAQRLLRNSKKGVIRLLETQIEQWHAQLSVDPKGLHAQISQLRLTENPDFWIVEQHSFNVSLVLHTLDETFVTFCNGDPSTIPAKRELFGVPHRWPKVLAQDKKTIKALRYEARELCKKVTRHFNRFIRVTAPLQPSVENAFRFTSEEAVIYNYPNFGSEISYEVEAQRLFCGTFIEKAPLSDPWKSTLKAHKKAAPRILISFGELWSARTDVVKTCVQVISRKYPESLIIIDANGFSYEYNDFRNERILVEDFIPESALLPHIDIYIHNGACEPFREALYYEKPMLVFPFSVGELNIGWDVSVHEVGEVLDPNNFSEEALLGKVARLLNPDNHWELHYWGQRMKQTDAVNVVGQLSIFNQRSKKCHSA